MSWREFWNGDNPIYVSERHHRLHCRRVADDTIALLGELGPGADRQRVLDFGCGRALDAARVAEHCTRLVLADSAPRVLENLRERFGDHSRIEICPAAEIAHRYGQEFDFILVNSVIQYLSGAELEALLAMLRDRLAADGRLVVADVLSSDSTALTDASSLLAFPARGGFLVDAVVGLARTAFSDYRKLRSQLGIARYDDADLLAIFSAAGLEARRHRRNLGHNPWRGTFIARPRS